MTASKNPFVRPPADRFTIKLRNWEYDRLRAGLVTEVWRLDRDRDALTVGAAYAVARLGSATLFGDGDGLVARVTAVRKELIQSIDFLGLQRSGAPDFTAWCDAWDQGHPPGQRYADNPPVQVTVLELELNRGVDR